MPSQRNLDGRNHPNFFVMAAPSVRRLPKGQSAYILVKDMALSDLLSLF